MSNSQGTHSIKNPSQKRERDETQADLWGHVVCLLSGLPAGIIELSNEAGREGGRNRYRKI